MHSASFITAHAVLLSIIIVLPYQPDVVIIIELQSIALSYIFHKYCSAS